MHVVMKTIRDLGILLPKTNDLLLSPLSMSEQMYQSASRVQFHRMWLGNESETDPS